MTDLIKKNGGVQHVAEWDPLRTMRELFRWDPFREMAPIVPAFDRMGFAPTFDITETKEAYLFKADVPGVKQEDLEISITGNRIVVSGKRDIEHEVKEETLYAYERQYGTFSRTFTLPEGADYEHAKSALENGVLTLVVPKTAAATAKKIPIATAATKS